MPLGSKNEAFNPDSDSEDDDYILPADENSDSEGEHHFGSSSITSGPVTEDTEETKRSVEFETKMPLKPDAYTGNVIRKRDALWAEFQASVSNTAGTKPPIDNPPPEKMVKVEKRYRFAGDDVAEVIEVPENSPDAKRWPLWKDPNAPIEETSSIGQDAFPLTPSTSQAPVISEHSPVVPPEIQEGAPPPGSESSARDPTSNKAAPPRTKRPGPRKPKTQLAALPGASKPKKLTTLDKSAMDWRAHIASAEPDVKDELNANRREGGGGYLEKVEFLKRVEERKEEGLEAARSGKRRKV